MNPLILFIILPSVSLAIELTYHVPEEKPAGLTVGDVASDANIRQLSGPDFTNIEYGLSFDPVIMKNFKINPSTGVVITMTVIDRETVCRFTKLCVFNAEVIAQSSIGAFFEMISLKIYIDDINDLTPTFPQSYMNLAISESATINQTFSLLAAVDRDAGRNAIQAFEMSPRNTPFEMKVSKNLDGTSDISLRLIDKLDREKSEFYLLLIKAIDGGVQPRTGTLTVKVNVTDVNDHNPVFTQQYYNKSVSENLSFGSVVTTVMADDMDHGLNGYVQYKFSSHQTDDVHSVFSINETTGEILLTGTLTSGRIYHIFVEASDMGNPPKAAQVQVGVTVLDTTNEAPVIRFNLFGSSAVRISEFARPGKVVMLMNVFDSDSGKNGDVSCNVENDIFEILDIGTKRYKIILAKTLDRETQAKHNVIVWCKDNGTPSLRAQSQFVVKVLDENDNRPKFFQPRFSVAIAENKKPGDSLIQVSASDDDEGVNAQVTYRLAHQKTDNFVINPQSGIIVAKNQIDRETDPHISLVVIATDDGKIPLNSSATVEIDVIDVNDNKPIFDSKSFVLYIEENVNNGTHVAYVTADDPDDGPNGEVDLQIETVESAKFPFTIMPNGQIKTVNKLDRETQSQYDFLVIATDNGFPDKLSSSVQVTINIVDINDNKPSILFPNDKNNTVSFSYPKAPNTVIANIKAFDPDEGINGELVYVLHPENKQSLYSITSQGEVVLTREVNIDDNHVQDLRIEVLDKGFPKQSKEEVMKVKIKFTNETLALLKKKNKETGKRDVDTHIIIVIAVIITTLLVSAIIITTICVIRKRDKLSNNSSNNKNLVFALRGDEARKASILESFPNNTNSSVEKDKTVYKLETLSREMNKNNMGVDKISPVTEKEPRTFSSFKNVSFEDQQNTAKGDDDALALKIHQSLLQQHGIKWPIKEENNEQPSGRYMDYMEKSAEYSSSEHSADITYDSGKGASEDEVHSQEANRSSDTPSVATVEGQHPQHCPPGNQSRPFYDPRHNMHTDNSFKNSYNVRSEEDQFLKNNFQRENERNKSLRTERTNSPHNLSHNYQSNGVSSFETSRTNTPTPLGRNDIPMNPVGATCAPIRGDNVTNSVNAAERPVINRGQQRRGDKRIIHNVLV